MGVHVSMERIAAYFVVNAVTKNSVNTSMVPVWTGDDGYQGSDCTQGYSYYIVIYIKKLGGHGNASRLISQRVVERHLSVLHTI